MRARRQLPWLRIPYTRVELGEEPGFSAGWHHQLDRPEA